jgi:EmrB/QacA subfamily drug resistance transporter
MAGFTVTSLLCGLSATISALIAFRAVEGLRAAMMMATHSALITNAVSPGDRGKGLSVSAVAVAVAVSACAGPSFGGFLATAFGWQSIFLVKVPIGLAIAVLAIHSIPNDMPVSGEKFDLAGSILIILSLMLILMPITVLGKASVNAVLIIGLLTAGLILFAVFLIHEHRCGCPILNLDLFRNRVFSASNFAATFFFMTEYMLLFLWPYYLQDQHRMTAATAGLVMLPLSIAMIIAAPVSGALSDKFGSRVICGIGMGIMAVAVVVFSTFQAETPVSLLLIAFAATEIGAGLFNTPNNSAVMGNVPGQSRGIASATLGTMKNLGMVLGEAVAASVFSSSIANTTAMLKAEGIHGVLLQQQIFASAMRETCIVTAFCAAAALVLSLVKGKTEKTVK